jgi:hypothetical protein
MDALRKRLCTGSVIAAVAGFMLAATPAYAVHLDDFQLDGDVKETTCGGAFGALSCPAAQPDDWDSLYSCPSSGTNLCSKMTIPPGDFLANVIGDLVDEFNLPDPDNFVQGTKDDMNVSAWNWGAASGSAKTNIMQSFASKYDDNIYIGANRDINNGDANFGVWLLQNATVKCTADMVAANQCATAGTFVGKPNAQGFRGLVPHKIGDILIVAAFTNGGTVTNINVYKVIQTVGNESNPDAVPGTCPANAFDGYANKSTGATGICLQQLITQAQQGTGACNPDIGTQGQPGFIAADSACAATNAGVVDSLDPRFKSGQSGAQIGKYPALTFFEVGLDLAKLDLTTECFPNYLVNGRQSQSVTSALNDFTLGTFQSCSSSLVTQASGPVTVGQTITDTATISGTAPPGHTPGGTVTFNAYSDNTCTTKVFGPDVKAVTAFGDVTSSAYTTTAVGTIYWVASYSGDGVLPAASGACGDANESSVVNKASPGISTTVSPGTVNIGDLIWDTATLSGGYSPGGTITFKLFPPSDASCTGSPVTGGTFVVTVSGGGADSRNSTTPPPNSGIAVTQAGTYHWTADYSGDANNNAISSTCASEPVVVAKNSPTISTTPKVQLIMTDVATLLGFAGTPTGTFTFNLYDNATCAGAALFTALNVAYNGTITGATTVSGTLPSASTYYTSGQTFRWKVSYDGTNDPDNNSVAGTCGEPVSISFQ